MKMRIFLGIFLIFFFFVFLIFFYFKSDSDKKLKEKKKKIEKIEKKNIEITEEKIDSSNIIEDVSYSAKDTKGNEYF